MTVTKTRNLGLTAFASHGGKETNVFARMAQTLVVIGSTAFVQLIQPIWRQGNGFGNIADTRFQQTLAEAKLFISYTLKLIQQEFAIRIQLLIL